MATNVDKALYEAPDGQPLDGASETAPDEAVELQVLLPDDPQDASELDDFLGEAISELVPFDANLADYLTDSQLAVVAADLVTDVENDLLSRRDWEEAIIDGMRLLGIKPEQGVGPWEGSSNVVHPLITEAVVRFQSESISETFPAAGPVRTKILGEADQAKEDAAKRVREDMNYQLTEVMTEYRGEHERMLWGLAITGSAFKKVYYDPALGRQVSLFVPAEDVILPYGETDITLMPRLTHRMRKYANDVRKLQAQGFYADVDLPAPQHMSPSEVQQAKDDETGFSAIYDDRHVLYEIQAELDLPGFEDLDADGEPSGIALPYIVTVEAQSNVVLAIRRNWVEGDEFHRRRNHFVHYQYVPGFGAYGMGLLHLVGNSASAATSLQRQLIDAGTLANLPGGLKTRGLRIKGENEPIAPGEFRDVDVASGTLRENIIPLPYKEPSQTLLAMMGVITQDAQRLASTTDMKISDMSSQAPVGTTLAIIERSLKILSAIQARLHYSLKQELKLLAGLIRDYMNPDYDYDTFGDRDKRPRAREEDFGLVDVIPVSDPNASTMAQRVVQYQAVLQLAQTAPQIYDLAMLHRQMLDVLGVKDAEKLVKLPEDQRPEDPVTENVHILMGEPVKAFLYQDHEAHIKVHMLALQDPKIAQALGQNPNAQAMLAAAQAHVAEHVAWAYRARIEEQMGTQMPSPEAKLPPHVEAQLSRTVAQAAQKLFDANSAEVQAQRNEAARNDPVVQLQQREMSVKEGELELKRSKLAADAAKAADEIQLRAENEALRLELEAFKAGAKVALDKAKLEADMQSEGLRVGVDVAKSQAQLSADMEQAGLKIGVDVAKTAQAAKQALDAAKTPTQPTQGAPDETV